MNMSEAALLMPAKIVTHTTITPEGCWHYDGRPGTQGYMRFGQIRVHVLAYVALVGPVPAGKVLDHICHDPEVCAGGDQDPHRACWNPDHLAPATRGENTTRQSHPNSRKTHCPRGHAYSHTDKLGRRICRTCYNELGRARRAYQRGLKSSPAHESV